MLYAYNNSHHTYCKCIGVDNKEYIIRFDALRSGITKTIHGACSGGKPHDISNQRFGRLTALNPIDERATNGGIRWKCICDCGNIIYPTMNNLKRGHTTSCGCAKQDYIKSCRSDVVGKQYGLLTILEDIPSKIRGKRYVRCRCDCGNIYDGELTSITTGHTSSCGCEFKSKGEKFIEQILTENNIEFIPQKRFKECKRKRSLPFDFYIPSKNTCIEYDGEQHFRSVKYWGGDEKLRYFQENDQIKNDYCNKHNIKLIRLNYKMKKEEIFEIIMNLISPATTTA